jgi:hypothetical protein
MTSEQQTSRINTLALKAEIEQKIGTNAANRYFELLTMFFSSTTMGKVEFENLCYSTIGRENIRLHNQLIRPILNNGLQTVVPPVVRDTENSCSHKSSS